MILWKMRRFKGLIMKDNKNVRFVRIRGRIVPIKGSGSQKKREGTRFTDKKTGVQIFTAKGHHERVSEAGKKGGQTGSRIGMAAGALLAINSLRKSKGIGGAFGAIAGASLVGVSSLLGSGVGGVIGHRSGRNKEIRKEMKKGNFRFSIGKKRNK